MRSNTLLQEAQFLESGNKIGGPQLLSGYCVLDPRCLRMMPLPLPQPWRKRGRAGEQAARHGVISETSRGCGQTLRRRALPSPAGGFSKATLRWGWRRREGMHTERYSVLLASSRHCPPLRACGRHWVHGAEQPQTELEISESASKSRVEGKLTVHQRGRARVTALPDLRDQPAVPGK